MNIVPRKCFGERVQTRLEKRNHIIHNHPKISPQEDVWLNAYRSTKLYGLNISHYFQDLPYQLCCNSEFFMNYVVT